MPLSLALYETYGNSTLTTIDKTSLQKKKCSQRCDELYLLNKTDVISR